MEQLRLCGGSFGGYVEEANVEAMVSDKTLSKLEDWDDVAHPRACHDCDVSFRHFRGLWFSRNHGFPVSCWYFRLKMVSARCELCEEVYVGVQEKDGGKHIDGSFVDD